MNRDIAPQHLYEPRLAPSLAEGKSHPEEANSAQPVRVLILGRYKLFRECLAKMLAEFPNFVVHESSLWASGLGQALAELHPDVLLIDLAGHEDDGQDSLELIRSVRAGSPGTKMVLLGVGELEPETLRWIEIGVSGYVAKSCSADELRTAIERVLQDEAVCPPRLAFTMFSRLTELSREYQRSHRAEALALTPRELEVLQLIAEGFSNQRIAERLALSIYTVKNHVHHVLDKLQVRRRVEAVEHAQERRWLR